MNTSPHNHNHNHNSIYTADAIKVIGESCGIKNLKESICSALANDVDYRIHELVQDACKFMRHGKRTRLSTQDLQLALKMRNIEPIYGYYANKPRVFKKLNTPHQEIYYQEDEDLDLEKYLATPLPPAPRPIVFTGVQPAIPQNPTPEEAKEDIISKPYKSEPAPISPTAGGIISCPVTTSVEVLSVSAAGGDKAVQVKPVVKHHLSAEMQQYYLRVTSALLDDRVEVKQAARKSLTNDPGLHPLLPYLVQFTHEKVSTEMSNLSTMRAMVDMIKCLLNNPNVFLEPYLHQLMPPLMTCLLGKRICTSRIENHWAVRDESAKVIAKVCNEYGKAYHTLRPRVVSTYVHTLLDPSKPLTSVYGAASGLRELGREAIAKMLLPNVKVLGKLLQVALAHPETYVRIEAENVQRMILLGIGQFILDERSLHSSSSISASANTVTQATLLKASASSTPGDDAFERLRLAFGSLFAEALFNPIKFKQLEQLQLSVVDIEALTNAAAAAIM